MSFYGNKFLSEVSELKDYTVSYITTYIKSLVKKYNEDPKIQKQIDKEYDLYIKKGFIKDKSESPKLIYKLEKISNEKIIVNIYNGSDVMINNILVSIFNKFIKDIKSRYSDIIKDISEDNGTIYIDLNFNK